jgi:hypothetical protein
MSRCRRRVKLNPRGARVLGSPQGPQSAAVDTPREVVTAVGVQRATSGRCVHIVHLHRGCVTAACGGYRGRGTTGVVTVNRIARPTAAPYGAQSSVMHSSALMRLGRKGVIALDRPLAMLHRALTRLAGRLRSREAGDKSVSEAMMVLTREQVRTIFDLGLKIGRRREASLREWPRSTGGGTGEDWWDTYFTGYYRGLEDQRGDSRVTPSSSDQDGDEIAELIARIDERLQGGYWKGYTDGQRDLTAAHEQVHRAHHRLAAVGRRPQRRRDS